MKPQNYTDPRPPEYFDRYHERARTREPNGVYELVRVATTIPSLFVYRIAAIGSANIPLSGPVILAPNHFSNMDHFFAGVYTKRRIQFMAKSQLFGNPVGDRIFSPGGVFPVRRGHADEEAFTTAKAILRRGGCVLMYAEGGRSRTGDLGTPRRGIGKLALESGVPVVPVAIHGSQGVRSWKKLRFPSVRIEYGEAIRFDPIDDPDIEAQQAAAERIFTDIRELYEGVERRGHGSMLRTLWRERNEAPVLDGRATRTVEPASPSTGDHVPAQ